MWGDDDPSVHGGVFKIRVEGHHHTGILHEVCDVLHSLGLDVIEANVVSDGQVDVDEFTVATRGSAEEFTMDSEKAHEMRDELLAAVDDPNAQVRRLRARAPSHLSTHAARCAQVVFLPFASAMQPTDAVIEIQMTLPHNHNVPKRVMDALARMSLVVRRGLLHETSERKDITRLFVVDSTGAAVTEERRRAARDTLEKVLKEEGKLKESGLMVRLTDKYKEVAAVVDKQVSPGGRALSLARARAHALRPSPCPRWRRTACTRCPCWGGTRRRRCRT